MKTDSTSIPPQLTLLVLTFVSTLVSAQSGGELMMPIADPEPSTVEIREMHFHYFPVDVSNPVEQAGGGMVTLGRLYAGFVAGRDAHGEIVFHQPVWLDAHSFGIVGEASLPLNYSREFENFDGFEFDRLFTEDFLGASAHFDFAPGFARAGAAYLENESELQLYDFFTRIGPRIPVLPIQLERVRFHRYNDSLYRFRSFGGWRFLRGRANMVADRRELLDDLLRSPRIRPGTVLRYQERLD